MNSIKILQIPDFCCPESIFANFVVQSGHIIHTTQYSEAKGFCSVYGFQNFITNAWFSRQIPSVPPRRIPTCSYYASVGFHFAELTVGFLDMTGKELPMIPKLLSMHDDSFAQHERFHGGYLEIWQRSDDGCCKVFFALALTSGLPKGTYQEPVILHLPWQELAYEAWQKGDLLSLMH